MNAWLKFRARLSTWWVSLGGKIFSRALAARRAPLWASVAIFANMGPHAPLLAIGPFRTAGWI
jgi:hypothetical protein